MGTLQKEETLKIELNKRQRLAMLKSLISCSYRNECLRRIVGQLGEWVKKENPEEFSEIMTLAIIKNGAKDYIVEGEDND